VPLVTENFFSAIRALPADRRFSKGVNLGDPTMRAERLAIIRREADALEGVECFGIG
jgi:hypothetical protein